MFSAFFVSFVNFSVLGWKKQCPWRCTRMKIFLAMILKFVLFLCLLCLNIKIFLNKFNGTFMGGGMILPRSLKTKRNNKNFQARPNFVYHRDPFILLIIVFSKICSINCNRDGFICQSWAYSQTKWNNRISWCKQCFTKP